MGCCFSALGYACVLSLHLNMLTASKELSREDRASKKSRANERGGGGGPEHSIFKKRKRELDEARKMQRQAQ